jgi:hypothetical protein
MRAKLFVLVALLVVTTSAAGAVDPALLGTWKLDSQGAGIFWVVRPDGFYRLHGPSVPSKQFGRFEGGNGKWSVNAPGWADQGTYKLSEPATWMVTGKFGTGTWKRVWTPGEAPSSGSSTVGACRLVTAAEVARVLYSPVSGGPDPRVPDTGCLFRSVLSSLDDVSISMRQNAGGFFQNNRKAKLNNHIVDVPGVGDQAFAEAGVGGALELQFLRRSMWITIRLRLQPDAGTDDIPLLIELARAADRRL